MKLFKKPNSRYFWFDFTVRGKRFRGSTKETAENRAAKIAALKFADACGCLRTRRPASSKGSNSQASIGALPEVG